MGLSEPDLDQQIDQVVVDLTQEFGERVGREHVREQVMGAYRRLSSARVKTFVPLLARKSARESLRRLEPNA